MQEAGKQVVDPEYAKLVGNAAATGQKSALPGAGRSRAQAVGHLADPFYDKGPNDKGIGIQLALFDRARRYRLPARGAGCDSDRVRDRHVAAPVSRARSVHPGAEADLAARLDAACAVHAEGQFDLRDFRDLHLLDVADADQHGVRGRERASRMAERCENARSRARCARPSA